MQAQTYIFLKGIKFQHVFNLKMSEEKFIFWEKKSTLKNVSLFIKPKFSIEFKLGTCSSVN